MLVPAEPCEGFSRRALDVAESEEIRLRAFAKAQEALACFASLALVGACIDQCTRSLNLVQSDASFALC